MFDLGVILEKILASSFIRTFLILFKTLLFTVGGRLMLVGLIIMLIGLNVNNGFVSKAAFIFTGVGILTFVALREGWRE